MKLNELRTPEGSRQERRRVGRGVGSGLGKQVVEDTKDKKHVVVEASIQYLKVDNYLYTDAYQREVLVTLNLKSFMQL